jgi:hypothetical protein
MDAEGSLPGVTKCFLLSNFREGTVFFDIELESNIEYVPFKF